MITSDHRYIPHAVFSDPQVASVGLTEEQAREQGISYVCAHQAVRRRRVRLGDGGRGPLRQAAGRPGRRPAARRPHDRPAGVLLIQPLIQAMTFGLPARDMARGQYWIHPALSEVVENALLALPVCSSRSQLRGAEPADGLGGPLGPGLGLLGFGDPARVLPPVTGRQGVERGPGRRIGRQRCGQLRRLGRLRLRLRYGLGLLGELDLDRVAGVGADRPEQVLAQAEVGLAAVAGDPGAVLDALDERPGRAHSCERTARRDPPGRPRRGRRHPRRGPRR